MPTYEKIREYYLTGKWNDRMLHSALVCKRITKDQYDEIIAAKAEQDAAAES